MQRFIEPVPIEGGGWGGADTALHSAVSIGLKEGLRESLDGLSNALHDLIFPSPLRGYISAGVLSEAITHVGEEVAPHHLRDEFLGKPVFDTLVADVLVKMLQFKKAAGGRTPTPLGEFIKVMLGGDGVQAAHKALKGSILRLAKEKRHPTLDKGGGIESGQDLPRTRHAFLS